MSLRWLVGYEPSTCPNEVTMVVDPTPFAALAVFFFLIMLAKGEIA
jgi:hypothetical protein